MDVANRRLHNPDDPVVADVSLEVLPGVGRPSESSSSYSLAGDTSAEGSPPHLPHPDESIGVLPTSSTAEENVSRTLEAVREGLIGDRTLLWNPTADGGSRLPGPLLLPPVGIGGEGI